MDVWFARWCKGEHYVGSRRNNNKMPLLAECCRENI